jgi:hypothetical protein
MAASRATRRDDLLRRGLVGMGSGAAEAKRALGILVERHANDGVPPLSGSGSQVREIARASGNRHRHRRNRGSSPDLAQLNE